jgi:hypothetical protein
MLKPLPGCSLPTLPATPAARQQMSAGGPMSARLRPARHRCRFHCPGPSRRGWGFGLGYGTGHRTQEKGSAQGQTGYGRPVDLHRSAVVQHAPRRKARPLNTFTSCRVPPLRSRGAPAPWRGGSREVRCFKTCWERRGSRPCGGSSATLPTTTTPRPSLSSQGPRVV